ncbi:hypothetical protein OG453_33630 [Streptomyces sp. NBC_01381]|uniref:hypothetical protein n=1 Tax=Streptomyces sp. NBC_01381 TaxID=2903845 RepID=UPI0022551D9D|nr:hypothetical protein [Streptomyces sp. NBC_01381]MCX4671574.1 hypothetical protein [Streptomyces sp. NBC_01381]
MYRLKYDPGVEAVHDALPPEASEQLSITLAAACHDPLGATQPYGDVEDDVMRMAVTEHVFAVLLLGHTLNTVTVLQINYLG